MSFFDEIERRIAARQAEEAAYVTANEGIPFRAWSAINGWTLLASPDPSRPGKWRVTRFEGETPVGHTDAEDFRCAVRTVHDLGGKLVHIGDMLTWAENNGEGYGR